MFGYNPIPKPNHSRKSPKRKDRGAISPSVYAKVMERDNSQCILCGLGTTLQIHHVKYRSESGDGSESNLVVLCIHCHNLAHSNKKKYQPMLLDYLNEIYGE